MQLAVVLLVALSAVAQARPEARVGVHDVFPGIGEYYFNGIPANWSTAYRQCQASGGHLTVINSVEEKEALQEMLTKHGASSVLIGFHDQFVEGIYTFITGWSVPAAEASGSLWAPGFPIGDSSNNCGNLNAEGIFDGSCSALSPFICELSKDQGGEDNGDGFALLEGFGYYKLHTEKLTWPEAWQTCREERSDLLVVDSEAELTALWNAYDEFALFVWLGVHRRWGPTENFVSVRNQPLSELYHEWRPIPGYEVPVGTWETNPYVGMYSNEGMLPMGPYHTEFFCERPLN